MPRPNRDRVMVSFYLDRDGKAAVEDMAIAEGLTKSDTYRELLKRGRDSTAQLVTALREVLAIREGELLNLAGPCSNTRCRLHHAHSGPCDCAKG
jgi:hypothetical protein